MKVLITAAMAAAMALTLPGLAAGATVTPRPASAASTVEGWGTNDDGALGSGINAVSEATPVKVKIPAGVTVTSIRAGCDDSVALTSAGAVLAWGDNTFGQVGDGTTKTRETPVSVKLPKGTKVSAVRAGCEDTIALTTAGTVLSWGFGKFGELGNGKTGNAHAPVAVHLPKGVKIKSISAGCEHNLALATSGTLYSWGANGFGQLGDGTRKSSHTPVVVKLPAGVKATGVTAGCDFALAFTTRGLYAWGLNNDGQLGAGNQKNHDVPVPVNFIFINPGPGKITSIFAGCNHTIALFSKGAVMAWGADFDGQLGDGGAAMEDLPVPVKLPATAKIKAISAGCDDGYALSATGQIFAWGLATAGELGNGGGTDSPVPVDVQNLPATSPITIGSGPGALHAFAIAQSHHV
jgi:alpha-tubulin suppressor-like RCC1 family protein